MFAAQRKKLLLENENIIFSLKMDVKIQLLFLACHQLTEVKDAIPLPRYKTFPILIKGLESSIPMGQVSPILKFI